MTIRNWSTTASANNAAPPNGWPEGMAPSGVNNSARQLMADVRETFEALPYLDLGHTATRIDGDTFTIATDLTATYTAGVGLKLVGATTEYASVASSSYSAPDTTVNVTGVVPTSLSTVSVGLPGSRTRYDITPAETAAGVTIVNHAYNYGVIDRYGTNTTPGTTDMTAAFVAAMSIANVYATMLPGSTYRVTSTLTLSGNKTLSGVIGGTADYQISTIYHDPASTGVLFDLTTSENGGFALQYFNITGGNGSYAIKSSRPYVEFSYINMEPYNGGGVQLLSSGIGTSTTTLKCIHWVGPASATDYTAFEIDCNGGDVAFDRCTAIRGARGFHIKQGQTLIFHRPSCNKQSIYFGYSSATQFNTAAFLIDGAGYKQSITIYDPYIEACTNGIYSVAHECLTVHGGLIADSGASGAIAGSYTAAGGSGNSLVNVANANCKSSNFFGVVFIAESNGISGTPFYSFYFGASVGTNRIGCRSSHSGSYGADFNLTTSTSTALISDTVTITGSNPQPDYDPSGLARKLLGTDLAARVGAPSYVNSWVDDASPVTYFLDAEGVVHISGDATGGTAGTTMFTLPVGYRPIVQESFVVNATGAAGIISINTTGVVTFVSGTATYVYLSSIRFRTR